MDNKIKDAQEKAVVMIKEILNNFNKGYTLSEKREFEKYILYNEISLNELSKKLKTSKQNISKKKINIYENLLSSCFHSIMEDLKDVIIINEDFLITDLYKYYYKDEYFYKKKQVRLKNPYNNTTDIFYMHFLSYDDLNMKIVPSYKDINICNIKKKSRIKFFTKNSYNKYLFSKLPKECFFETSDCYCLYGSNNIYISGIEKKYFKENLEQIDYDNFNDLCEIIENEYPKNVLESKDLKSQRKVFNNYLHEKSC